MGQTSTRFFSVGWVVVSYFMLCGAILIVTAAAGPMHLDAAWAGYAMLGLGALLGGFSAGRASAHFSVIEATLAGLLVVGSVVAFVLATPLASMVSFGQADAGFEQALVSGATAAVGAFAGSWLGEATSRTSGVSTSTLRWLWTGMLISLGTLWTALLVASALILGDVSAAGDLGSLLDQALTLIIVSLVIAAFAGEVFTQSVAPRRMIVGSAGGTLLAYLAVGGLILANSRDGFQPDSMIGAALLSALAALLAGLGAAIAWIIVGRRVRREAGVSVV